MPLSLAERTDLANDPRMRDDKIRMQVFAKIAPEDQAWLTEALKGPQPPDVPGAMKDALVGAGNYVKNNPRKVGAAVGGIGATLATGGAALLPEMAAAGLGGMAGAGTGMTLDAMRQFFGGAPSSETLPSTPSGTAKAMIDEGGGQMLSTGIGGGIARLARGTGTAVMNGILPKSIAEDFPQAAETLAKNAINPSTESGLAKASGLRRVSASNTRNLATAAEKAGAPPITEGDILPSMGQSVSKAVAERKAGNPGGAGIVRRRLDALMDAQPPRPSPPPWPPGRPAIPLSDASDITRELQDEGRTTLDALSSAQRPSRLPSIVANDLASGVRQTANARIPGYQASNATTQNLIGAERAAAAMKDAPLPVKALGYRLMPALAIGGATGYATGSPTEGALVGALPLALGVPQIAGPAAIAAYKAGSLPYSMLIKAVSPQILEMLGITPPNLAQQVEQGK